MGKSLNSNDIIGFIIKKIYCVGVEENLYTIEINCKCNYKTKGILLDMSFYYKWEELLNVDMYELKKHLAENFGLHRKIGPSRIIYWDNIESAQKAVEYLKSLVIMQKLCS